MNRIDRVVPLLVVIALLIFIGVEPAKATSYTFDVSLNTSSLSGTQALVFSLTDGDGVVDNSVTLSNFSLGGGTTAGTPNYFGTSGVSGDLSSGVALNDSGGLALFTQDFNPGTSLSYVLTTTNNFSGGTPDGLAMQICDPTFTACYSDDMGSGALLSLGLDGTTLTPSSFTATGATLQGLPAPVVTTAGSISQTPEPASAILFLTGLTVLCCWMRR